MGARVSSLTLTRVGGIRVGHASTPDGHSGVTAILFGAGRPAVVDIGGGASATYDTASLGLDATFGRRWGVFFSGGSLYGLDAARGVRTRILEEGGGTQAFENPHPLVPLTGAALFDLPRVMGPLPDYIPLGYAAACDASKRPVVGGRIGAGSGASVGKYLGRGRSMPGGLGSSALFVRSLGWVGALAVVNSVGAVRDHATGSWLAGARGRKGQVIPPRLGSVGRRSGNRGTTLALIATEVALGRSALRRLAVSARLGLARTIIPFNTSSDGDVVFGVSTERIPQPRREAWPGATVDRLGLAVAEVAAQAAENAVRAGDSNLTTN
ncbi:MAG: P1 family peptidase [Thermoplasmata archaeon]